LVERTHIQVCKYGQLSIGEAIRLSSQGRGYAAFAGFAIYRAKLGGHGAVDDGHIAVDREVASRKVVYWRAL
jgi:hypothetical protein